VIIVTLKDKLPLSLVGIEVPVKIMGAKKELLVTVFEEVYKELFVLVLLWS